MFDTVLFDLDGTLTDPFEGILFGEFYIKRSAERRSGRKAKTAVSVGVIGYAGRPIKFHCGRFSDSGKFYR